MNLFLVAAVGFGAVTIVMAFIMLVSVDIHLPEGEDPPWKGFRRPSIGDICALYDRFHPDNYMTPVFRVSCAGCLIFGIAAAIASFYK